MFSFKLSVGALFFLAPLICNTIKFLFDVADVELLVKLKGVENDESILSEAETRNQVREAG